MGEKKNTKKITLACLLAKAEQSKTAKVEYKEVYIPSLKANITIKKLNEDICFSAIDKIGDTKEMAMIMETYDELIYHSCDLLHEKELVKAYEVTEPTDLPKKMFTVAERSKIGETILEVSGFGNLDDKVKN